MMSKLSEKLKSLPKYFWVLAAVTAASQFTVYYLPRVLHSENLTRLSSALDDKIPVVPAFAYVYVAAFVFWVVFYIVLYLMNKRIAYRVFTADLLCKLVCVLAFCLYPCTMDQPAESELHGVGAWLMRIIYASDEPTQLLPSMHCYISILLPLALFSKYANKTSARLKIFAASFGVLICLSTVFIKQHVLMDVYTGAALAAIAFAISSIIWRFIDKARPGLANAPEK